MTRTINAEPREFWALVTESSVNGAYLFAQWHPRNPQWLSVFGSTDVADACRFSAKEYALRVAGRHPERKFTPVLVKFTPTITFEE